MATPSPATPLSGQLFGHGPGGGERCDVEVTADAVVVTTAATRFAFPLAGSSIEMGGYHQESLVVESDAPSGRLSLFLPRQAALAALRQVAGPDLATRLAALASQERRRGRSRAAVWAAIAVGLVVLGFVLAGGVKAALRWGLGRIPPAWEVSLGQSLMASMHPPEGRLADPVVRAGVDAIGSRLLEALGPTPYTYEIHVVPAEAVNAFALPGGQIAVFTGLIERCETPEELAAVLAHEVQHVARRHSLEAIADRLRWSILLALLTGDLESARGTILGHAAELASLGHGRDAEREADREGLGLLVTAGIDPSGMIRFFEALHAAEGGDAALARFLSTHPGGAERAAALRAMLPPPRSWRPIEVEWDRLRAAAAAAAAASSRTQNER